MNVFDGIDFYRRTVPRTSTRDFFVSQDFPTDFLKSVFLYQFCRQALQLHTIKYSFLPIIHDQKLKRLFNIRSKFQSEILSNSTELKN